MNPQLSQSVHGIALETIVGLGAGMGAGPIRRKTRGLPVELAQKSNIYLFSIYLSIFHLHLHWPRMEKLAQWILDQKENQSQ